MLAHLTLSSSYVPPLIAGISGLIRPSNATFLERLPYFSWMPFRYDTPGTYLLALGYQAGPMFSYAYSIVGMDTLFMNSMNCVVAHLVVVQGAFRSLRRRCVRRMGKGDGWDGNGLWNTEEMMGLMMVEMKKCCRHLQRVFWLVMISGQRCCLSLRRKFNKQNICPLNLPSAVYFRHKYFFRVCEELERLHKYLTLGQMLATLFILCTSLYLVSTVNSQKT